MAGKRSETRRRQTVFVVSLERDNQVSCKKWGGAKKIVSNRAEYFENSYQSHHLRPYFLNAL